MLLTQRMELSIDPATWLCVHILTQVFKMKAKEAEEQGLTFSFMKTMPCPDKKATFSIFPKERGVLFITDQEMLSMRNTLENLKWAQPK